MDNDRFKIFVHRLKDGEPECINECFEPSFLDVEEKELHFHAPIHVTGEACVSNNNFFLSLSVQTEAQLPCLICNEPTKVQLKTAPITHTQPMAELKSGLFHMKEMIREGLLLEVPLSAECSEGQCPERQHLKKYFFKEN